MASRVAEAGHTFCIPRRMRFVLLSSLATLAASNARAQSQEDMEPLTWLEIPDTPFGGEIDDVRFYRRALTELELLAIIGARP